MSTLIAGLGSTSSSSTSEQASHTTASSSASSISEGQNGTDEAGDEEDGDRTVAAGVKGKDVAKDEHAFYCFDVLYEKLKGSRNTSADDEARNGMIQRWKGERYPLFVTWNTKKQGYHPCLRGCIGNFSAMDLEEGLRDYASISAFKDRRFSPIALRELPSLSCSVSLLHSFEQCADHLDWSLGTHGIHIFFPDPKTHPPPIDSSRTSQAATPRGETEDEGRGGVGGRSLKNRLLGVAASGSGAGGSGTSMRPRGKTLSATYLPDVATDQGWTKIETIDSAIRKAGYEGKITEAIRRTLKVERYQSAKVSVTYADWKDWRSEHGRPVATP